MTDLRSRAKAFYSAFDFARPINFGLDELLNADLAQPEALYVERLHGDDYSRDPIIELADQIDYSQTNGTYLFSGNRGSGKTTELMRLAKLLRGAGYELFYVDLAEQLPLTIPIEISGLTVAMLGGLSDQAKARFGLEVGKASFFERVLSFLRAGGGLGPIPLPANPAEFKAALRRDPGFALALQQQARGRVHNLVELARHFTVEVVNQVRVQRGEPFKKIVLLVDSLEHVQGVGSPEAGRVVLESMEHLFAANPELLRLPGLSVVYTVPPHLQALVSGLGSLYAGGRVFTLPSVHIYEQRPAPGRAPEPSERGLAKLLQIVERRHNWHGGFFSAGQLRYLAQRSGGDLRDFFRMLRLAVAQAARGGGSASNAVFAEAEDAVRRDMLPLANDDLAWLKRIAHSHQAELPSREWLLDFARLLQNKQVLACRNGEDWYVPHPLLRQTLDLE